MKNRTKRAILGLLLVLLPATMAFSMGGAGGPNGSQYVLVPTSRVPGVTGANIPGGDPTLDGESTITRHFEDRNLDEVRSNITRLINRWFRTPITTVSPGTIVHNNGTLWFPEDANGTPVYDGELLTPEQELVIKTSLAAFLSCSLMGLPYNQKIILPCFLALSIPASLYIGEALKNAIHKIGRKKALITMGLGLATGAITSELVFRLYQFLTKK
jgi:hypothetical protein